MNYGFKSITIEPFNGYLDFQGPINPDETSGNITLKGDIRLKLTKTVKVKSATLKFKGNSRVYHQNAVETVDISTPILPKLKTELFTSTTSLGPGEVTLPWELEIVNLYPASVMIKRASISYKIELTISLGLNRAITAEYPIVVKRHLIPCLQVAPLVAPKLYTKTISTKFHYEINAPRIVCVAQGAMPMTIKLLSIGAQKRVLSIRTQLLQVELYRCTGIHKSEADMTKFKTHSLGQKGTGLTFGKKGEANKYAKYTKRTTPAIIHTLDEIQAMPTNQPLLIRHPLGEYLTMGLESPLAAIYHQLEITFQFGAKFEDIRAKIPIVIASAGPEQSINNQYKGRNTCKVQQQHQLPMALYPFEKISVVEPISVSDERRMDRHALNITAPSRTRSASNSDATTVKEEEDGSGISETVNDLLQDSTNNDGHQEDSSATALLNTINPIRLNSPSLRRARSAVHLTTTTPSEGHLTDEEHGIRLLKPTKEQSQYHQQPTNTLSQPTANKPVLVAPLIEHTSPHAQSKRLLNSNMEKASAMWSRPGTQTPQQWRRRSNSQPFLHTGPTISTKPPRDAKRQQPNLTIIPTSIERPLGVKDDGNDDSSLVGASESSVSSTSPASSIAAAESIISSNASSHYEPQSRPASPTFAPAPGLPSFTNLHPQEPASVALLEESFILSPGSMASTPLTPLAPELLSPTRRHLHRTSLQYTQGYVHSHGGPSSRMSDVLSVTSNAQSSVLDPDENMMRMMQAMEIQYRQQLEQQQSLEQHYTYAKLPPLPTAIPITATATDATILDLRRGRRQTTICYADDSSEDDSVDDDSFRTTDMCNTANENGKGTTSLISTVFPPPIANSSLPPPPSLPPLARQNDDDNDEPVCLCPKHGVVVARR